MRRVKVNYDRSRLETRGSREDRSVEPARCVHYLKRDYCIILPTAVSRFSFELKVKSSESLYFRCVEALER